MAELTIKPATASDEASVIAVVVLAFSADPAARWTWPDPRQYLRHFPDFVKALGGKAFAHGGADYVDGGRSFQCSANHADGMASERLLAKPWPNSRETEAGPVENSDEEA
jgi:hypothetical protein